MKKTALTALTMALGMCAQLAYAGPLDPECTPEKAAKSAATKATVGVGGRCDAKETAADSAKRTAGVDDKARGDKRKDDDKPADAAKDTVKKAAK
jgi:hypothetical protein